MNAVVEARVEKLFRQACLDNPPLRFNPFAQAVVRTNIRYWVLTQANDDDEID